MFPGFTSTFIRGFIPVARRGSQTEPVNVLSPEDDRNKAPDERTLYSTRESGDQGAKLERSTRFLLDRRPIGTSNSDLA